MEDAGGVVQGEKVKGRRRYEPYDGVWTVEGVLTYFALVITYLSSMGYRRDPLTLLTLPLVMWGALRPPVVQSATVPKAT